VATARQAWSMHRFYEGRARAGQNLAELKSPKKEFYAFPVRSRAEVFKKNLHQFDRTGPLPAKKAGKGGRKLKRPPYIYVRRSTHQRRRGEKKNLSRLSSSAALSYRSLPSRRNAGRGKNRKRLKKYSAVINLSSV